MLWTILWLIFFSLAHVISSYGLKGSVLNQLNFKSVYTTKIVNLCPQPTEVQGWVTVSQWVGRECKFNPTWECHGNVFIVNVIKAVLTSIWWPSVATHPSGLQLSNYNSRCLLGSHRKVMIDGLIDFVFPSMIRRIISNLETYVFNAFSTQIKKINISFIRNAQCSEHLFL